MDSRDPLRFAREVTPVKRTTVALPEITKPRTFRQRYGRYLYPVIGTIGGLALLGGTLALNAYGNRSRQPPNEPAKVEQTSPEQNPVVIPPVIKSTPTPEGWSVEGSGKITVSPTPAVQPTATPKPVVQLKPFELTCSDGCTEQEIESYTKIAEDDYNAVKEVYGLQGGRMVVSVSKIKGGVGFDFYIDGKRGSSGGYKDDFTPDPSDRGNKHEMAHAINAALFPNIPSWLDEGTAIYAGEGIPINSPAWKRIYSELKTNPHGFWESKKSDYEPESSNTPGHLIGTVFFGLMETDYGFKKQNYIIAIQNLANISKNSGILSEDSIRQAFESSIGVKLDSTFQIIDDGIYTLYRR